MERLSAVAFLLVLSYYGEAQAQVSVSANYYHNEQGGFSNQCGSFCQVYPPYYQSLRFYREQNSRVVLSPVVSSKKIQMHLEKGARFHSIVVGVGWRKSSSFGKAVTQDSLRWAELARDVGVRVQEQGKSLFSSVWREARRPVLFKLRDLILKPYKNKSLSLREKVNAWVLDQTIDSGAASLGLKGNPTEAGVGNMDFGIKNYRLKVSPRWDPIRGRYGMRLKYNRFLRSLSPLRSVFSYNYCRSSSGWGSKVCQYQHEVSASVGASHYNMSGALNLSYQTVSLDPGVYQVDGEFYDHKPWHVNLQFSYLF